MITSAITCVHIIGSLFQKALVLVSLLADDKQEYDADHCEQPSDNGSRNHSSGVLKTHKENEPHRQQAQSENPDHPRPA